jgi:serine/threonine-protein kinase
MTSARRLAMIVMALPVFEGMLGRHQVPVVQDLINRFFTYLAEGALYAVLCFTLYLAIEPFVRRTWPKVLIAWTRLLGGGFRDPMVGRSLLYGAAMLGVTRLASILKQPLEAMLGDAPGLPALVNGYAVASGRVALADIAAQLPNSMFNGLFFLTLLVVVRMVGRRAWLSYLVLSAITAFFMAQSFSSLSTGFMLSIPIAILWTTILVRVGMLAFFFGLFLQNTLSILPMTLDTSQAYSSTSMLSMLGMVVLLVLALGSALGGRSLLRDET